MNRLRLGVVAAVVMVAAAGCGGGGAAPKPAQSAASSPSDDPVKVTGATPAQVKLGHFVTPDGRHGFVLDRTGAKAKLQVDGSKDVVELTEEEARKHGDLEGYNYLDPAGKKRIFISKGGGLRYFVGGEEYSANHDKGAKALGSATVAGAPKKEEPAWKARSAELEAKSVVKTQGLRPEDASDLKKVEAAFAKADAGSFYRYVERDKGGGWAPKLDVAPSNVSGPGFGRQRWKTDEAEAAKHKKLAAYGAVITGYSDAQSRGNHVIAELKDHRPALASGTPGVVWAVDDSSVTFVSFDGGRYVVDLAQAPEKGSPLEPGAGPEGAWPKPVQDPFLDYGDVGRLVKVGAAPRSVQDDLEKADDAWNACAQKAWKPADAKIEVGKFKLEDAKALSVKAQASCRKHLDQFETALVAYLDQRKAERAALYDKAKARAAQLGVAKLTFGGGRVG
ncbi:MAG TPA: hypothetical protein VFS43_13785 [Polyangiaceae bacterium]|nr:hypothetical protein [Polyangiaceae bacterium]